MFSIRLLLVDENDDFLDGLSTWLAESPSFQVVGVAHSANEAIERIATLAPHLVLMDMRLPDMSGLETTRRIKSRPGAPLVILTSFHDSASARTEALAAGADGCLSKTGITGEFLLVVETLLRARARRSGRARAAEIIEDTKRSPVREIER